MIALTFYNLDLYMSSRPFSILSKECAAALLKIQLGRIPFILLLLFFFFRSCMFVEYSFRGIPLVVFVECQQKILFLASVLINPDILMCVMMGCLMDSHLYPVIN